MHTREAEARTSEPTIESLPDEKSQETAEIMRRFNEVFLRHDPSELKNLVAENCVIEKINPGPDSDRWVGREACIANWEAIATKPGSHFDLEEPSLLVSAPRSAGAITRKTAGQCAESI
jgi:SnoaL-like domain